MNAPRRAPIVPIASARACSIDRGASSVGSSAIHPLISAGV
jgi:hypothetical protein